tara:strand:+ start:2591 stop:2818 length:228 start_codon:yes stop_codon:yes gene_type:complete
MSSQIKEIRHYLESGGKLTPLEALDKFGCFRLAAIVHNLREEGLNIKTTMVKQGQKSFAEYSIDNSDGMNLFGGQ